MSGGVKAGRSGARGANGPLRGTVLDAKVPDGVGKELRGTWRGGTSADLVCAGLGAGAEAIAEVDASAGTSTDLVCAGFGAGAEAIEAVDASAGALEAAGVEVLEVIGTEALEAAGTGVAVVSSRGLESETGSTG